MRCFSSKGTSCCFCCYKMFAYCPALSRERRMFCDFIHLVKSQNMVFLARCTSCVPAHQYDLCAFNRNIDFCLLQAEFLLLKVAFLVYCKLSIMVITDVKYSFQNDFLNQIFSDCSQRRKVLKSVMMSRYFLKLRFISRM